MSPKPSVGRIVHYVSHGSPVRPDGTQAFTAQCRAAVVTEVELGIPQSLGGERVGLAVLNPTGIFLHSLEAGGCKYHDGAEEAGSPDCPDRASHGNPFRYCACGWREAAYVGGTWHWPRRTEDGGCRASMGCPSLADLSATRTSGPGRGS